MAVPTLAQRLALRKRPPNQPVMYQTWENLLFIHWRWSAAEIQQTLPPGLYVDTFEGQAYIGVVPFFMQNIRPRFCPVVPGISNFLELNVRTYVHNDQGVAGVWFYSLDANQWLAVKIARQWFRLPYQHATMQATTLSTGEIDYISRRLETSTVEATRFIYQGYGDIQQAEPSSLEFFLLERYILFSYNSRQQQLATGQVYHPPYPYQSAYLAKWDDRMLALNGFAAPQTAPDHVAFSPGVTVDVFGLLYPSDS